MSGRDDDPELSPLLRYVCALSEAVMGLILILWAARNFSCGYQAVGFMTMVGGLAILVLSVTGLRKHRRQSWRDIEEK